MSNGLVDWTTLSTVVSVCEDYAREKFPDDSEFYTSILRWRDGDFQVTVYHGKRHQDSPYRQDYEQVSYRHWDGVVVYSDETRYIDHRKNVVNEREELQELGGGE